MVAMERRTPHIFFIDTSEIDATALTSSEVRSFNKPRFSTRKYRKAQIVMRTEAGGTPEVIQQAADESHGLGLLIRSLVGLDRETATHAFNEFVTGSTATPNQFECIDLIVQYLTENGVMDAARLYESPLSGSICFSCQIRNAGSEHWCGVGRLNA
ncbi:MAG: hypothetical protein H7203_03960 [Rhizobacter sp.]|nr:hypothetical protein [Burkholderiales bacterium]